MVISSNPIFSVWMNEKGLASIILVTSIALVSLLISTEAEAVTTLPRCAIIIVSDLNGFNQNEIEKADEFYQYLLDQDYSDDDIRYLTDDPLNGYDADPTISNINSAFSWLKNTSSSSSQPVIYISDHVKWVLGNSTFQFSDGNITANSIDDWFDETEYQELTVILNGNRSALAGSDLSGTDRDILCSMGSTQSFQTDQFNITRSLEDPTADSNSDGEVSYMEAFLKEDQNLQFDTQDPESFS